MLSVTLDISKVMLIHSFDYVLQSLVLLVLLLKLTFESVLDYWEVWRINFHDRGINKHLFVLVKLHRCFRKSFYFDFANCCFGCKLSGLWGDDHRIEFSPILNEWWLLCLLAFWYLFDTLQRLLEDAEVFDIVTNSDNTYFLFFKENIQALFHAF